MSKLNSGIKSTDADAVANFDPNEMYSTTKGDVTESHKGSYVSNPDELVGGVSHSSMPEALPKSK